MKINTSIPLSQISFPNSKALSTGLLLSYNNEILLVRSSCAKDNHGRDIWGYPKGTLEQGETIPQAAIRETLEETGLVISPEDPCFQTAFCTYTIPRKNIVLFYKTITNADIPAEFLTNNTLNPDLLKCSTTLPNSITPEIDKYMLVPSQSLHLYLFNHMRYIQEHLTIYENKHQQKS